MPYDMHGVKEIADTIVSSEVTAVLVHSDYLAIAISQALEQRGKHVPEDISIISIDGFATPSSRPLTVLRSSAEDLAEVCIRTLVNRIPYWWIAVQWSIAGTDRHPTSLRTITFAI